MSALDLLPDPAAAERGGQHGRLGEQQDTTVRAAWALAGSPLPQEQEGGAEEEREADAGDDPEEAGHVVEQAGEE